MQNPGRLSSQFLQYCKNGYLILMIDVYSIRIEEIYTTVKRWCRNSKRLQIKKNCESGISSVRQKNLFSIRNNVRALKYSFTPGNCKKQHMLKLHVLSIITSTFFLLYLSFKVVCFHAQHGKSRTVLPNEHSDSDKCCTS